MENFLHTITVKIVALISGAVLLFSGALAHNPVQPTTSFDTAQGRQAASAVVATTQNITSTSTSTQPTQNASAGTVPLTVNNYITQPVIYREPVESVERTIQPAPPSTGYVSESEFTTRLNELSDRFGRIISGSTYPAPATNLGSGGVWNAIAATNKIDHLSNITVSGVSGLTASDIPSLSYLPLSGGTITGDATLGSTTVGTLTATDIISKGPTIDVRAYGAKGDGTADDTAAIQAAINAANAAGGGNVLLPPGTFAFSGSILVPSGVNLVGSGSGKGVTATTLKATAAGSRLSFGATGSGSRGGVSGSFNVDGNVIATNPLYVGRTVQRTFLSIVVSNSAGNGLVIEEAQNNLFESIDVEDSAGNGIVFDRGAGGNVFIRVEVNATGGGYGVLFQQTASSTQVYREPTQNAFYHSIIERPTATSLGMIEQTAGADNSFYSSHITATGLASPYTMIEATTSSSYSNTSSNLRFDNSSFQGDITYATAFKVGDGASIRLTGVSLLTTILTAFNIEANATVSVDETDISGGVVNWATGAGADNTVIRKRLRAPLESTRYNATDYALIGDIRGEAGPRFGLQANGTLNWGDGTSVSYDTNLFRDSANVLRTNDSLVIDGNVGIGTTSPQTKLGLFGGVGVNGHQLYLSPAGVVGIGTSTVTSAELTIGDYNQDGQSQLVLDNGSVQYQIANSSGNQLLFSRIGNGGSDFTVVADPSSYANSYILVGTTVKLASGSGSTSYFNGGNVGIATSTPWRTLSVTGTVGLDGLTGNFGAGSLCLTANKEVVYNSGSDACLSSLRATKHDITTLNLDALDMVKSLQPVSFIYNNDASSTVRYGFIAEDTAAIDSHLATHDASGAISGIDDRSIIAVLVDAVQSLIQKFADLAERLVTKEIIAVNINADTVTAKKIRGDELCAGNTCVTETQLQALLNQAGQQSAPQSQTTATPESTSTTETKSASTTPATSENAEQESPATTAESQSSTDAAASSTEGATDAQIQQ